MGLVIFTKLPTARKCNSACQDSLWGDILWGGTHSSCLKEASFGMMILGSADSNATCTGYSLAAGPVHQSKRARGWQLLCGLSMWIRQAHCGSWEKGSFQHRIFKYTTIQWQPGITHTHIYIYICCEVIIWAKFGHFRCYYLGQVGVIIWAKLFLAYKNSGFKRFFAHTVII